MKRILVFFVVLAIASCSTEPTRAPSAAREVPTILVSFDGFRDDYLDRRLTPTFARLARGGVGAEWLTPAYPSLTFPNHYTIVTGLDPDRHGIVHNTMRDPVTGAKFAMSDRAAVETPSWWGGEPIWATGKRHGLRSATLFWVGSEAPIGGAHPDEWLPYDVGFVYEDRVTRVLEWLARPPSTRPHFATLYIELLDKVGHEFGPESPEMNAALVRADALLAQLLRGLGRLGIDANLVIVSDHGMAAISPARGILLDELFPLEHATIVSTGEVVTLTPLPEHVREVEVALLRDHAHMACWRKTELPARFRYGTHPRIPAIVCQAADGWVVFTRAEYERRRAKFPRGAHGFDNASPTMRAIFIAKGPAFRSGVTLEKIEARDVYNVLAGALGIEPAPNDGNPDVAREVLE